MNRHPRPRLAVEALEQRACPALAVHFDGTNLTVGDGSALHGTPSGGTLTITENADTTINVADAAGSKGTFAVGGTINVRLGNTGSIVNFDLGGNTTAGCVNVFTGNGGDTIAFISGGTVGKNLLVNTGNGADKVDLTGITVQGSTNLITGLGDDSAILDTATFRGNFTAQGINKITSIADGFTALGNVLLSASNELATDRYFFNGPGGTVATSIGGNLTIITGNATDLVDMDATVGGSVLASMGGGNNTFTIDSDATVGANVSYIGGAGDDTVTDTAGSVIGNNLSVNLGGASLSNAVVLDGTVGGRSISVQGGNGSDNVTVDNTFDGSVARFSAFFGAGSDTFTLHTVPGQFDSLFADMGTGADTFVTDGIIDYTYSVRNV